MAAPWQWDLFCRVVDNFGDVGVCWRLACDLAARGERVRLWIDDAGPLAWMAPGGCPGLEVGAFDAAMAAGAPGDVVIEAFGCDPPPAFVATMAAAPTPPVWINLEYLSAEPFVERSHGLPSPQRNGLTKWFYYPGFTPRTGGLLREPGLLAEREAFDADAWLAAAGFPRLPGERVVSLFCYDNSALPALLNSLADAPTLLLLTPGFAQAQVAAVPPGLRTAALPWLTQREFDRLLWASDLNFVRGEDSLVRAIWAGAPFVWQIYPQHDGAHAPKLRALLDLMSGAVPGAVPGLVPLWHAWNGLHADWPGLPEAGAWRRACEAFRAELARQTDLTTALQRFVCGKSRTFC
jgi:uncharacterized repeat protein (TIGR03837 family)